MRKNKWLCRVMGFSVSYLAFMILTPNIWKSAPVVAIAVLCLTYIILFVMANWKGRWK